MGTNFYWNIKCKAVASLIGDVDCNFDHMDPTYHIGKRSAAGLYCWDCGITLCKKGNAGIHVSENAWHEACPRCGGKPMEPLESFGMAASIELGFAKHRTEKTKGVCSCSSFSWAQDPERVRSECAKHPGKKLIVDEYGRSLTGRQFVAMLKCNCPVEFTDSIGHWFS